MLFQDFDVYFKSEQDKEEKLLYAFMSLEKIPDSVFWVDDEGNLSFVNEAACRTLGYTREELLTFNIRDFDPIVAGGINQSIIECVDVDYGGLSLFRTFHKHKDGHLIPVEVLSTVRQLVGNKYLATSIVRDITDRIQVEEELKETYNRLEVLYNIYQATTSEKNINRLIRQAADIMKSTFEFDAFVFYFYDDYLQSSALYYTLGLPKEIIRKIEILPQYVGFIGQSLTSGFVAYSKYTEKTEIDENIKQLFLDYGFTDEMAFPIMFEQKTIGGIGLINKHNKPFKAKDKELLQAVCGQLSTVIQNLKLIHSLSKELKEHKRTTEALKKVNAELEKSAFTDQLTNIWNRRCFLKNSAIEIERSRRNKYPLSLLLLDIDHFKLINDNYGHQAGDQALIEFANLLRDNIRSFDSLARWGGEEFLILAPHLRAGNAVQYADRLRELIAEHPFQEVGEITASIGVAELANTDNIDSWIKKVDNALYRAKEQGRNRVEFNGVVIL